MSDSETDDKAKSELTTIKADLETREKLRRVAMLLSLERKRYVSMGEALAEALNAWDAANLEGD